MQVVGSQVMTGNELIRQVTQNFDFSKLSASESNTCKSFPIIISSSSAYTLCRKIVRALGDKLEKAFKDPIEEIKQEFGLIEENFFEDEEIQYLGDRSFS